MGALTNFFNKLGCWLWFHTFTQQNTQCVLVSNTKCRHNVRLVKGNLDAALIKKRMKVMSCSEKVIKATDNSHEMWRRDIQRVKH